METPSDNLAVALDARAKGIAAIPVLPGTKIPAVKWKQFQTELPSELLLREWFAGTRRNIAIVTSGMVVFDCDDPAMADLVLEKCGETSHMLKSPSGGIHLGYRRRQGLELRNQVKVRGRPIDVRTDGGLEMIPCSETEEGRYEWLGAGLKAIPELPVANVGWTRERARRVLRPTPVIEVADRRRLLFRARRYLEKIEPAVSGQGGHNKTYSTACKLARLVGFDGELLWLLLLEYNARCLPPWSEPELRHKWEDALKQRR